MDFVDRLFDSLFGYISLTQIEREVIQTPIFQRLHHIKQLGMANIVFPTALHTRFSHSLGVLFIMDKLVSHIRNNLSIEIDGKKHQLLRLAALLHDIGHLPFSHAGEQATESVAYRKINSNEVERTSGEAEITSIKENPSRAKLHERLSRRVVERWNDLKNIFGEYDIDAEEVGRIIVGASAELYQTFLLHSELDADRLDYLLRDSNFLGVSYGNIELDHIISMVTCASEGEQLVLGVDEKGLHAVEHYAFARYFMYSQIVYYPKIWYLEHLLKDIYEFMIESTNPNIHIFDYEELLDIIDNNRHHKFYDFNDHSVFYKMRQLHDKLDNTKPLDENSDEFIVNENIKLLLSGQIPDPLIMKKALIESDNVRRIRACQRDLNKRIQQACEELGIPPKCIAWGFPASKPSKIRESYPLDQPLPEDVREEAIRIIYPDASTKFFVQDKRTLLRHISDKQLQYFYLFINPLILSKKGLDLQRARRVFEEHINLDVIF